MDRKQWLRGIAVSLSVTGFSEYSLAQQYMVPGGSGLTPSSYPIPSPLSYGGYPQPQSLAPPSQSFAPPSQMTYPGNGVYVAQNNVLQNQGHIHVPIGNYTAAENIQGPVPPSAGNPTVQPPQSYTAPLPPVNQSGTVQSSHLQNVSPTTPMYQVPAQNCVPQATYVPPTQTSVPQAQHPGASTGAVNTNSSCQSCNQPTGQLWNGYSTASCAPSYVPSYASSYPTHYGNGNVSLSPWIFGANALIFNRVDNDYTRFSSSTANPAVSVLSTFSARSGVMGGLDIFGGRYFGGGKFAVMGGYWGLYPADQSSVVYDPELNTTLGNSLRPNLPFTVLGPGGAPASLHGIEMPSGANVPGPNGGQNVYDWYDNAYAHRLVRSQNYNSAELNIFSFALGGAARNGAANYGMGTGNQGGWANGRIGRGGYGMTGISSNGNSACGGCGSCSTCGSGASCGSCGSCNTPSCSGPTGACGSITGAQCSRLRFAWLGGLRWFRFGDYMEYATSENDGTFGGADDLYYRNTVRNDLVGFQLGGRATYCTGRRINLYSATKFGVFGNRINYDTFAGTNSAAAIVSSYDSYDGQAYDLHSSTTGLSLLGEGELGTGVRLSRGWTANCGYRVIGVSGIATAPGQIPYDFSLLNDVQRIHHNDSLVLHGVSLGGMYNW